jgi:hypothetical protein
VRARSPWARSWPLLAVGWAIGCGGPQKLGEAGAKCFRDDDCVAGLICVIPDGKTARVCSADPTSIVSMVDGPPVAMGGGAGTPATAGAAAGGTSGAGGTATGGVATGGVATGGAASGGGAGRAGGGSGGTTEAGGTATAGAATAGTDPGGGSGGTSADAGAPP